MGRRKILVLLAASLLAMSCAEKRETKDIIVPKPVEEAPAGPRAMQDYTVSDSVRWCGKTYTVEICRRSDKDMQTVTSGAGGTYYDNRITVRVTRPDGTVFFNRDFTKSDFSRCVGEEYINGSALLGFVLEKAEGDYLQFAASVGDPDVLSDEYIPLLIRLSRTGEMSVERDTRLEGEE